ncbi:TPA: hypothetical protein LT369_002436 [Salmonella enterica]|nr:hypothetical protein [Salmonella enterica]
MVLRWAPGTQIKTQHVAREAHQPVSNLLSEPMHRQRVVFQHNYPARLPTSPFDSAPVIPVRTVIGIIYQQMSIQLRSETLGMTYAGMMADHHKLNVFSHQQISNKKAARWQPLFAYQGVAFLYPWLKWGFSPSVVGHWRTQRRGMADYLWIRNQYD